MNETPNPYQSPVAVDRYQSWWTKLRGLLGPNSSTHASAFSSGDAIICCGIAYSIDPDNSSFLYASSPSAETSQERMNLIIAETIRVLPIFLADYPELHPLIRGRKLAVRMTKSYSNAKSDVLRVVELEWDIVDAVLASDPDDESVRPADSDDPAELTIGPESNG